MDARNRVSDAVQIQKSERCWGGRPLAGEKRLQKFAVVTRVVAVADTLTTDVAVVALHLAFYRQRMREKGSSQRSQ